MTRKVATSARLARIEKMFQKALAQRRREKIKEEKPSILEWVEENLWISPKSGGLIRFKANKYQKHFFDYVQTCLDKQRPIRLVILKSRQLGISTAVEAFLFYMSYHYPMTNSLVLAHRRDSARKLFLMVKRFYHNLPIWAKKPLHGGKPYKDGLEYAAPHSSHYHVLTAGGDEIGRGWTLQFVHASEVAFYNDPEGVMTALSQCIPKPTETSLSAFILESTANGQNLFQQYWDLAQNPESGWVPLFYSWKDDPDCKIDLPSLVKISWDKDEIEFMTEHDLTPQQMLWARNIREDQCLGSWARFNQEYPVSPPLAFVSTGWPVFRQNVILRLLADAQNNKPIFEGQIEFLNSTQPIPQLVEMKNGPLCIWEYPQKDEEYVLGVDTAEGIGSDYSEIVVLRRNRPMVVAHYRDNKVQPQEFGVKVWLLGAYYYWGLLGVERNTVGQVVLGVLEHGHGDRSKFPNMTRYPHLYYETRADIKSPAESERLGFQTSRKTKGSAIARLAELISDDELIVYSIPLLNQLRGFMWQPETKKFIQRTKDEVSELYNDDGIMALAIANEMRVYQFGQRFMPKIMRGDW